MIFEVLFMQFLTIKKRSKPTKSGKEQAQAFVVKKTRKFGKVLEQTAISTKSPVLITGAHASGKSYWIGRLHKDAARVWASRSHTEPIYLAATFSISDWTSGYHLEKWWASKAEEPDKPTWRKLTAGERQRAIADYLSDSGAVLFIDDAHKLAGKKLEIAKNCIRAAKIWVVTAPDEGRLSPTLRKDVLSANPQIFRLNTDVAYDATGIVMWLAILVCMGLGAYEIAAVLGGLKIKSR
jgi:hypothetical protein